MSSKPWETHLQLVYQTGHTHHRFPVAPLPFYFHLCNENNWKLVPRLISVAQQFCVLFWIPTHQRTFTSFLISAHIFSFLVYVLSMTCLRNECSSTLSRNLKLESILIVLSSNLVLDPWFWSDGGDRNICPGIPNQFQHKMGWTELICLQLFLTCT